MTDREKITKGLECCKEEEQCRNCPYANSDICIEEMSKDVLALLKEQDDKIKLLEHQLETVTKWRANAGAFD